MKKQYFLKLVLVTLILFGFSLVSIAQTSTFVYTGSIQTYIVPPSVTIITVTAKGAQGGGDTLVPATGGRGAIMTGTFPVVPGQVLKVLTGQQGVTAKFIGGGGGGSFVWNDATVSLLIAAGGGGGAGRNGTTPVNGLDATTDTNGVNGGDGSSGGGIAGSGGIAPSTIDYAAGGGGWRSNGDTGSVTVPACSIAQGGATPLSGGAGGLYGGSSPVEVGSGGFGGGGGGQGRCGSVGGGGGGGYAGGGGGGNDATSALCYGGGGGGSYNGGNNRSGSVGQTGDGVVIIAPCFISAGVIAGLDTVCVGYTITLADTAASGAWSSVNGNATVSALGIVMGVTAGTDTIKYTKTNACGTAIAILPIFISTVAECTRLGVPVAGSAPAEIEAYPNPFSGELTISGLQVADKICLYDIVGTQVNGILERMAGGTQTFSMNSLPAGVYILQVTDSNGNRKKMMKVVKE